MSLLISLVSIVFMHAFRNYQTILSKNTPMLCYPFMLIIQPWTLIIVMKI